MLIVILLLATLKGGYPVYSVYGQVYNTERQVGKRC